MASTTDLSDYSNFFTRSGADAIVRVITDYWTSRGYLGIRVEKYELPGITAGTYGVRSNMVGGIPPRSKSRTALLGAAVVIG
jgi:hypothetical protein